MTVETTRYPKSMNDQPTSPAGAGLQSPPDSPLQGSAASASARIQTIIEAAEQAAGGIIDEAEAQARRYLEESRLRAEQITSQRTQEMSALTDALIERAEALKHRSDELLRTLDQAKHQIEERLQAEPASILQPQAPPPPAQEAPPEPAPIHHLKPVEQEQPQEFGLPPEPLDSPPAEGARLLATRMAVKGNSRAEIEISLREEFGIDDAESMLDAILGREG